MRAFVGATKTQPDLAHTLAHTLATVSLGYMSGASIRCEGLQSGKIASLRNKKANEASVKQMVTAATSASEGLTNHITNTLMRLAPQNDIANRLIKVWNVTALL